MLHIVEIRHIGTDLDATRQELTSWLADHGIERVSFEHSTGGPGITFKVYFVREVEAAAFADAFRGRLDDGIDHHSAQWIAPDHPGSEAASGA